MRLVVVTVAARQWKKNFLRHHKDWLPPGRSVRLLCGTKVKARAEHRAIFDGSSQRSLEIHSRWRREGRSGRLVGQSVGQRTKSLPSVRWRARYIMRVCREIQRNAWCTVMFHRCERRNVSAIPAHWTTFAQRERANGKMSLHTCRGDTLILTLIVIFHVSIPSRSYGFRREPSAITLGGSTVSIGSLMTQNVIKKSISIRNLIKKP